MKVEQPNQTLAKWAIDEDKIYGDINDTLSKFDALALAVMSGANYIGDNTEEAIDMLGKVVLAAFGGPQSGKVNVEGGEVVETPNGQVAEMKGPSHEKGGIDVLLPEWSKVFSKRIKIGNETIAERKLKRVKEIEKLKKKLEKNPDDIKTKNTLERLIAADKLETEKEMQLQMQIRDSLMQDGSKKFATGGITLGSSLGILGSLYSGLNLMKNTYKQRSKDTVRTNYYENVGVDAEKILDDLNSALLTRYGIAFSDLDTQLSNLNRNMELSSKSSSTDRAMKVATAGKILDNKLKLWGSLAAEQSRLGSTMANVSQQNDIYRARGAQQADDLTRQDRDAFYSQLARDIASKGEAIQGVGKILNDEMLNDIYVKLLNQQNPNVQIDRSGNIKTDITKLLTLAGFGRKPTNLDKKAELSPNSDVLQQGLPSVDVPQQTISADQLSSIVDLIRMLYLPAENDTTEDVNVTDLLKGLDIPQ